MNRAFGESRFSVSKWHVDIGGKSVILLRAGFWLDENAAVWRCGWKYHAGIYLRNSYAYSGFDRLFPYDVFSR